MRYVILNPEVGGNIYGAKSVVDTSVRPPRVMRLDYEFDGWLGDDLVTSFPCYIVTSRLAQALREIEPTGCEFDHAYVSKSEQFEELYPNEQLPDFVWLKVTGRAGVDDFGETDQHEMVVSERVMRVLERVHIENCDVKEYASTPVAA